MHPSDLGSKSHVVDGVLGALLFAGAEVEEDLAGSVQIRQRTAGNVDVARAEIIQYQSHIVTRVYQSSAHLQSLSRQGAA